MEAIKWAVSLIAIPITLAMSFIAPAPKIQEEISSEPIIQIEPTPSRDEPDVLWLISYFAQENGVDVEFGHNLAWIESRWNPLAENPSSTAKGVFQWLDSSWESLCEGEALNAYDNVKCSMEVLGKGGISHWLADPSAVEKLVKIYPEHDDIIRRKESGITTLFLINNDSQKN